MILMSIPSYLENWFKQKGWHPHNYQRQLFEHYSAQKSTLLVAPTGGGKTLAGFLPAVHDIVSNKITSLHTIYISPLKALTHNVFHNLSEFIKEINVPISIGVRTGDTSTYQRQKQMKHPPPILLTTPESLMLLLSYSNSAHYFKNIKLIIIDELHSFALGKRGDLTTLALAQLGFNAPAAIRVGLSATVAQPQILAKWLVPKNDNASILQVASTSLPNISLLKPEHVPYSGYTALHSTQDIYEVLLKHQMTLVFVNTRSQAEFLFRQLWLLNVNKIPVAIYHASLSKEQRQKTEKMVAEGLIKAVVSTSALELGIDWGNVDAVIQVGAPHGVSRLVQRIGRSNHQFNKSSLAYMVPVNCFDTLESQAAINAIRAGQLDYEDNSVGALDVVIQFIVNCACSQPIKKTQLYRLIKSTFSYRLLSKEIFEQLFRFAVDGGYTLQHYPEYHRLQEQIDQSFIPASTKVIRRHRQNIGTIIDSPLIKVKIINKRSDKYVGEIDEFFVQGLKSGDTFLFAGEILEFVRVKDLWVETRKIKAKRPKIPSYKGGIMPLTTFLSEHVLALINKQHQWVDLPQKVQNWLHLQKKVSLLPNYRSILVEQFIYKKNNYLVIYSFEGRKANNSLGMLITRRLEHLGLKPLHFTVTDYTLLVGTLKPVDEAWISSLFDSQLLFQEIDQWLAETTLLKRTFRQIAIISGLTERQIAGNRKSMKQVTFSTDLIFDVLQKYEPGHILLLITHEEVKRVLLDVDRLTLMLKKFKMRIKFMQLERPSPFSVPILANFLTEKISGEGEDEFLRSIENETLAKELIQDNR